MISEERRIRSNSIISPPFLFFLVSAVLYVGTRESSMKKKKQRDGTNFVAFVIGVRVFPGLLLLLSRRRRLLYYHLLPFLAAVVACLLLLIAFTLFLCPQNNTGHPHRLNPLVLKNAIDHRMNVELANVFRVPRSGGSLRGDLWSTNHSGYYYGCSSAFDKFHIVAAESKTQPNRYLLIATSGGLNQQRTGITDAVVAAYILNATLVVPTLDPNSYWKDSSNFSDIFDVDWFISYLSKDVKIIKELPAEGSKYINPYRTRVPRKCNAQCYKTRILPLLNKKHAVRLTKFDYRLSNRLDDDLQKLRCRVNYHGLRFTDPILDMGRKLVQRMRMRSKHFITLHLRFEPDMLAFSGCDFGGGDKERKELGTIRKRWKTLHAPNPEKERRHGKCPLSPEEIGLMLRALGFGSDVHIYVASGEVYGGEYTLAPLKALFPNIHSKETITTKEELEPYASFSSRMAALDFMVCDESDVFVTNNNGNMAKMLAGRRRYFGHKPTIRPNAKKLYRLFMNRSNMTWEEFASRVRSHQIGFMGEPKEMKPGRGDFHENPSPCICESPEAAAVESNPQSKANNVSFYNNNMAVQELDDFTDEQLNNEEEQDWSDTDYSENEIWLGKKLFPERNNSGSAVDEIFSD